MSRICIVFLCCVVLINVTTSSSPNDGRYSGMDRMDEAEIKNCLTARICPVTMELEPMCCSDGKTYPNRGTVRCLNQCLKAEEQVTIVSGGFCKDDLPK